MRAKGKRRRGSKSGQASPVARKSLAKTPRQPGHTAVPASGIARSLAVIPALREVRDRLVRLQGVCVTVSLALQQRNEDYDQEIALTLRTCVTYELDQLLSRLNSILGIGVGGECAPDSSLINRG